MSRKVLTSPYIVWGAAFIILPLFMVIYYGCTGSDGNFTLSNITAMADPCPLQSILEFCLDCDGKYNDLSGDILSVSIYFK